jgi:integrase
MAQLTLPGGRTKYLSAMTEPLVREKLRKAKRALAKSGDLPTSSPTVAQWVERWLVTKRKTLKPRTWNEYRSKMALYVIPAIGRVRLENLRTEHIEKVHDLASDGRSSTTALQTHRILSKCLNDAMAADRLDRNVATLVEAPRRAVSTRGSMTADEAKTLLLSVASDPVAAVHWSVALFAGLRQGERLGMTREQVDLDRGIITVSWALSRLTWEHGCLPKDGKPPAKGQAWPCGLVRAGWCPSRHVPIPADQEAVQVHGGLWLQRPKSRSGWREVPMTPHLAAVMKRHLESTEPGMHGLILHRGDGTGRPVDPRDDTAAWKGALDAAGLARIKGHEARHTTATLLHALKVSDSVRQAILGHSSATVTAGYTHVSTPEMVEAMGKLGALLEIEGG